MPPVAKHRWLNAQFHRYLPQRSAARLEQRDSLLLELVRVRSSCLRRHLVTSLPQELIRGVHRSGARSAAYLAEVVRGGLQALSKSHAEPADAVGLSYWKKMASWSATGTASGDPVTGQHMHWLLRGTSPDLIVDLFDLL
jgi:hypothetical protein